MASNQAAAKENRSTYVPQRRKRFSNKSTNESHYMAPKEGDRLTRAEKRCAQMAHAILCSQQGAEHNLTDELTSICDRLTTHYKVKTAIVSIAMSAQVQEADTESMRGGVRFIAASGLDLEVIRGSKLNPVSGGLHFGHYCCHRELPIIVLDALDSWRYNRHPLVTGGPQIRFYAGQPITIAHPGGTTFLGTLCIMDDEPRESFLLDECNLLEQLSKDVSSLLMTIPDLRTAMRGSIREHHSACNHSECNATNHVTDCPDPDLLENQFALILG